MNPERILGLAYPSLLHLAGTRVTAADGGGPPRTATFDFWADESSGSARYIERDQRGNITVDECRDGHSVIVLNTASRHMSTETYATPADPRLLQVADRFLRYRRVQERWPSSRVTEASATTSSGAPALRLIIAGNQEPGPVLDALVSPDERLPLEELFHESPARTQPSTRQSTRYEVVERMSVGGIDSEQLRATPPADWNTTLTAHLSVEAIRAFERQPVFWLGETFDSYRLVSAHYVSRVYRHGIRASMNPPRFEATTLVYDLEHGDDAVQSHPITVQSSYTQIAGQLDAIKQTQGMAPSIPVSKSVLDGIRATPSIHLTDGKVLVSVVGETGEIARQAAAHVRRAN